MTNTELTTVKVRGFEFDVHYTYESEKDPFGTGDSPTLHYVELIAVETVDTPQDLLPFLSRQTIDEIEQAVLDEVTQ